MITTKPKTKFYVGFSTDQEGRRPLVHKNHIPWWPIKCTDPGRVLAVVDSLADLEDMWPGVVPAKTERIQYFRFSKRCKKLDWFVPLPGDEDFWLDPGADTPVFDENADRMIRLMDEFDGSWSRWLWELEKQTSGTGFDVTTYPAPPALNEDQFMDLDLWLDGSTSADELSVRAFGHHVLMTVRNGGGYAANRVFSYNLLTRTGWEDVLPFRHSDWDLNDVHDLLRALPQIATIPARKHHIVNFLNEHPKIDRDSTLLSQIMIWGGSGGVVCADFYGRTCLRFFTAHNVLEFIRQGSLWLYLRTEHLTAQHLLEHLTQTVELFDQAVLNEDSEAIHSYLANLRAYAGTAKTTLSEFSRSVAREQTIPHQRRWGVSALGPALLFFSRSFDVEQTPNGICATHHPIQRTVEELEEVRVHYSLFEEALDNLYYSRGNTELWQALNVNRIRDTESFDRHLIRFMTALSWVDDCGLQAAHQGDVFSFGRFAIALETLEVLSVVPNAIQREPSTYASNYLPEFMRRSRTLNCGVRCVVTTDYSHARDMTSLLAADGLQPVVTSELMVFSKTPEEFEAELADYQRNRPVWAFLRGKGSRGGCLVVWVYPDPRHAWEFAGLMSTLRSLCLKPLDGSNPNGWANGTLQQIHDLAALATSTANESFF